MKFGLLLLAGAAQLNLLTVTPPPKLHARRGETVSVKVHAQLRPGYHCNSSRPSEDWMIPLKLTWTAAPLTVAKVTYPKAQMEKYPFSPQPISVLSGDFDITTEFTVPAGAPSGPNIVSGTLRYQACDESKCYPPQNVPVPLSLQIQ